MKQQNNTAILYAFVANAVVGIAKGGAAFYTGSGALLAETLHSVADCSNQILLWIGLRQSRKPASVQHPLGHGKELYFWSFVVAVLLFMGGGVASVAEGISRLRHPGPIGNGWVAMSTLVLALVCESLSLKAALRQASSIRSIATFYRWFRDTRRSELLVIVSEDAAAVIGVCIALIAVALTLLTHRPEFDAAGSIAIGVLLVFAAGNLIVEVKALLIGESAHKSTRDAIEEILQDCDGVVKVRKLITLQYGRDIFVATCIQTKASSLKQTSALLRSCRRRLRKEYPNIRHVFIEPSV